MASSSMVSHDYHMDVSSSDISSSSQMITRQLVEFRSIEELQEQNQRLLSVVRELGEQNEQQEKETLDERTQVSWECDYSETSEGVMIVMIVRLVRV